jgi:hypothetical protein
LKRGDVAIARGANGAIYGVTGSFGRKQQQQLEQGNNEQQK